MELQAAHPDQPWLWRADWAAGEIHFNPKAKAIGFLLLTVFWNLCSWAALASIPTITTPDRNKIIAWIMLFPLVGLGLLVWEIRLLLRWAVMENRSSLSSPFPAKSAALLKALSARRIH